MPDRNGGELVNAARLSQRKMIKLTVVLAAAALFAVAWSAVPAAADPRYDPRAYAESPDPGGYQPSTAVAGKEYSTHGDTDHWNVPDPGQVQNWDGFGGTYDGIDYGTEGEVDALANHVDEDYYEVIGDVASLLFSVDDNGSVLFEMCMWGYPATPEGGVWATPQQINAANPPQDIDALEVYGPEPPYLTDPPYSPFIGSADRYSLEDVAPGMPDPLGVSVWDVSGGGPAVALWSTADIARIVELAANLPIGTVDPGDINLDGLMTYAESEIMFSIDPITMPTPYLSFDGGEIFVGTRQGGPGNPNPILTGDFLWHGGHLWDTAFPVAATFGLDNENVNAIEAVSGPEPATLVLVGLALLGFIGFRRRGRNA